MQCAYPSRSARTCSTSGPGIPGRSRTAGAPRWTPTAIVAQARRLVAEYGFSAIKLKGGVLPPDDEIAAIRALREEFPAHPLRLDPNAAWTVETAIHVGRELDGVLEYLEDPTPGIDGMAQVAREVPMPLATNMCVVSFDQLPEALAKKPVGIVLSDHHFWGGLTRSHLLAGICDTFGLGPIDALELAPGHQPGRDDAPWRGHPEPHLCLRHALALEGRR